jgi:subtilisin family serine protease
MKLHKLLLWTVIILLSVAGVYQDCRLSRAGEIEGNLNEILQSAGQERVIQVLIYLNEQADLAAITDRMDSKKATLDERHETVVRALRRTAETTQGELAAHLDELEYRGAVKSFKPFWIVNAFRAEILASAVEEVASHQDVSRVYFNYEIELIEPEEIIKDDGGTITNVEIGVEAVRAPEVWALGITGAGVLVANMDTGVDGSHPALDDRWAGVADPRYEGHPEWAWYDPYAGQNDFPYDNHGHGTHTIGSVTGADPNLGDTVGVAPGAHWIASAPIDRGGGIPRTVADAILSFEWMVDPDGDPGTNWDVPAVCSNSWGLTTGHGYPPCDELFWSYLDACEAAGTVILFSAGNEGYSGLRRPADRATDDYRTCAVAAVDANNPNWPIASFSSRGPTYCTPGGEAAIKPDIAAPGVSVRSCYPGGGYTSMSGTSMASPHVNGVVALMRQANPNISVEMIKQIIYDTAYDLGNPGEDNDYGWGMVDAYEAVTMAMTDFGYVEGYVTDATNSDPLQANIEVLESMISVQADENGYYILGAPSEITYTLRASLFGYFTQDQEIYVVTDDTVSLDFQLEPWPPPLMSYDPSSFDVYTEPGNVEERTLTIYNDGDGPLYYYLSTETLNILPPDNRDDSMPLERPDPLGYRKADPGKSATGDEPVYPPVITGEGGPDNYGYIWIDSDEPGGPAFEWIDISSIGVPIDFGADIDDGNSGPISLGFTFPFYGNEFSSINVCSNGWASFTDESSVEWGNQPIPHTEAPNNMLAAFYDDLNFENGGTGYFYTNNVDSAIITWDHVPDWRQEGIFTFQIILTRPAGITCQYLEMGPGRLDECSIGIENSGGTDGLEVVYNAPYMHENLAIRFGLGWLLVSPSSGIIDPHDSHEATVTFDASILSDGVYTGSVHLDSNDPVNPEVEIPATLNVGEQSTGSISGIVTDELSNPIMNVHVIAEGTGVTDDTDVNGAYNLPSLLPATYDVSFSHDDYRDTTVTGIEVLAGQNTPLDVEMILLGECDYTVGDFNGSAEFNVADVVEAYSNLRTGLPEPDQVCECPPGSGEEWAVAMDVNNSCAFNVADIVDGYSKLKTGEPEPVPCEECPPTGLGPGPDRGEQPLPAPTMEKKATRSDLK